MKTTLQLLTLVAMLCVAGCGKDDDGGGKTDKAKLIEQISAKWDINSSAKYVSLELNKSGNYIVVENPPFRALGNDQTVIFGTYKVLDATTVELVNFGKITINSITSAALSIKLTVNNTSNPIELSAQKIDNSSNIPTSAKTDLLCRTWVPTKIDGTDISQITDNDTPTHLLFSAAGTYLLSLRNGKTRLCSWKWFDSSQNKFYYSWSIPPVWQESGESNGSAEITSLSSSKLIVTEREGANVSSVIELKPAQ